MFLGKPAGEDEVKAELLTFSGPLLWDLVVKVCRERWLLLTDTVPGAEVVWPSEWYIGWLSLCGNARGTRRTRTYEGGSLY